MGTLRKILHKLCRYFIIKKGKHSSLLLKFGLHIAPFFQRLWYGKGTRELYSEEM